MITAQSGVATIRIDDGELLKVIDKISESAGTTFIAASRAVLEKIHGDAMDKWPVRSGLSKKSFAITEEITQDYIKVSLGNTATNAWGAYAYKIRWSIWTAADLRAKVEEAASNAKSEPAAQAIRVHMAAKLRRLHGDGAPSEDLVSKRPWTVLVGAPQKKATKSLVKQLQDSLGRLGKG